MIIFFIFKKNENILSKIFVVIIIYIKSPNMSIIEMIEELKSRCERLGAQFKLRNSCFEVKDWGHFVEVLFNGLRVFSVSEEYDKVYLVMCWDCGILIPLGRDYLGEIIHTKNVLTTKEVCDIFENSIRFPKGELMIENIKVEKKNFWIEFSRDYKSILEGKQQVAPDMSNIKGIFQPLIKKWNKKKEKNLEINFTRQDYAEILFDGKKVMSVIIDENKQYRILKCIPGEEDHVWEEEITNNHYDLCKIFKTHVNQMIGQKKKW